MSTDGARPRLPARLGWNDLSIAVVIGLGMVVVYMPRAWAAIDMSATELLSMTADVFAGWTAMGLLMVVVERALARRVASPWLRTAGVVVAAVGVRGIVPMALQVLDGTHHTLDTAPGAMRLELIWSTILCAAGTTVFLDRAASRRAAEASLASLRREQREVRRRLVEGRLQVLQARVDPQLFFDTLGRVRDRYDVDAESAEVLLERLIVFLRAALPRLTAPMSTLAQEAALASAYVGLLLEAGLTRAVLEVELAATAAPLAFPAGVLLPLLDAVLHAPCAPVRLRLDAARGPRGIELSLVGMPDAAWPKVDGVRQTLQALYAEHAGIAVRQGDDGLWRIVVELPATPRLDAGPRTGDLAPLEPYPVRVVRRPGTDPEFEEVSHA